MQTIAHTVDLPNHQEVLIVMATDGSASFFLLTTANAYLLDWSAP